MSHDRIDRMINDPNYFKDAHERHVRNIRAERGMRPKPFIDEDVALLIGIAIGWVAGSLMAICVFVGVTLWL